MAALWRRALSGRMEQPGRRGFLAQEIHLAFNISLRAMRCLFSPFSRPLSLSAPPSYRPLVNRCVTLRVIFERPARFLFLSSLSSFFFLFSFLCFSRLPPPPFSLSLTHSLTHSLSLSFFFIIITATRYVLKPRKIERYAIDACRRSRRRAGCQPALNRARAYRGRRTLLLPP